MYGHWFTEKRQMHFSRNQEITDIFSSPFNLQILVPLPPPPPIQ